MTWPLADLPPLWRVYAVLTYAAALVVIALNVWCVLPELAREAWRWLHEALRESRSADGDAQQSRLSIAAPDNAGRDSDAGPAQVLCDGGDGSRGLSLARQAGSEPADSLRRRQLNACIAAGRRPQE